MANRLSTLALQTVCLTSLAAGIVWNIRFAVADHLARENQEHDTRLAMRFMPANGAYAAQLADELYASDPAKARSALETAVTLNSFDAAGWIQLGLLQEAGNNLEKAEAALLQAATVDATFLPSWSLANFYFRHENGDRFWYWAERAVQMAPDDVTALFRLAWYTTPDVAELENHLQIKRPALEGQLVSFLMTQNDAGAVTAAALHLLQSNSQQSVDTLLGACEWLIAGKHFDRALSVWNGLAMRRLLPYPPLTPGTVTNGEFAQSPSGRGFDWRLPTIDGVSSFLNSQPNALGFEFSGAEPDSFLLMREAVPVTPEKNYALVVDYETTGIAPGSGVIWAVSDGQSGAVLAKTASLSAEQGGRARACFTAPQGTRFVDLSLSYQRQPGSVRAEGKVTVKQVRLAEPGPGVCG